MHLMRFQGVHIAGRGTVLTTFLFNQLLNFLIMMNGAIIYDNNTVFSWVWIELGGLGTVNQNQYEPQREHIPLVPKETREIGPC
jgi:hypothetical protein